MIQFNGPATAPEDEVVCSKVREGQKEWFQIIVHLGGSIILAQLPEDAV